MEDRCLLSAALPNGTANAIAYDAGGKLWVAYYDAAEKNLKYALRNADGTWANLANNVIDDGAAPAGYEPDVGQMVTMTIERAGRPGVAYYDAVNADLKYAYYNGTSWDVSVVESYRTTGYYPSIAFNPATNRPAIAYHYATNGDLRLRQFNGTNWGGDADYQWIDGQADNVGRFGVLALDRAGRWAVGYDDSTNGAAKFAYQGTGGVWSVKMVDNVPTSDIAFTSIAFDSNNRAALAYYDTALADLKFAKGNDSTAATWRVEALAQKNTAGKYTNMSYDAGTDKFTVYYNLEAGGVTRINYVSGNVGGWADAQTLYAGGGSEARIVKTPGVSNGLTFSWSALNPSGETTLYVNDTTAGTAWRQETADAGFNGRVRSAGTVVHAYNGQEKIYAIGGRTDSYFAASGIIEGGPTNLVRASADGGVTWTSWAPQGVNGGAAFDGRHGHATVSFKGKLWVIGGETEDYHPYRNDVWSSADGVTWTRGPDMPAAFAARAGMAAVVSGDGSELYLIGGHANTTGNMADVWTTQDGETWERRTAAAPFGQRTGGAALWFNGRLWLLGGEDVADNNTFRDDAWWSADGGRTWANASDVAGAARYGTRSGFSAVVHDNRMWVLGGEYYYGGLMVDRDSAMYSFDGVNWTTAAQGPVFQRKSAGAVSSGGRLVYVFGDSPTSKADVWSTT